MRNNPAEFSRLHKNVPERKLLSHNHGIQGTDQVGSVEISELADPVTQLFRTRDYRYLTDENLGILSYQMF
jgi:hypothetical protein